MNKVNNYKLDNSRIPRRLILVLEEYGVLFLLIIICIIFGLFYPKFLTWDNFTNIFMKAVPIGIAALGLYFVAISGGLDLTIGAGVSLGTVVLEIVFRRTGSNITLAILASIFVVLMLGVINGMLVSKLKINSIIVTLVMMTVTLGVARLVYNLSGDTLPVFSPFFEFITRGKIFNVPSSFIFMILAYLIVFLIFKYTRFGLNLISIGNNAETVRVLGINVNRHIFLTFVISGFFMGLTNLVIVARVRYISLGLGGTELLLDVLAAVIIGGVTIGGGKGKIPSVLLGVIFISIVNNMVNIADISSVLDNFFKGCVIIIMIAINRVIEIAEQKRRYVAWI